MSRLPADHPWVTSGVPTENGGSLFSCLRPWNRADRRLLFVHWDNLLPQLRQEDPESWFNYMRMRPEMFNEIHQRISGDIEKNDTKWRFGRGKNRPCYPVLCRFEPYCSRIASVLFLCLPYCSRFFPIFPCFSSTGQNDGGGVVVFARSPRFYPFLPVSPPFFPCHSRSPPRSPRVLPYRQYGEKRPNTGYV